MRWRWLTVIGLLSLGVQLVGHEVQQIELNCNDTRGCFGKLEEAVEAAPEGSTIRIGPGTYYERPLLISKSLLIEGAGSELTEIRAVAPGAAITIRSPRSLSVIFKKLALITPALWVEGARGSAGMGIAWGQEGAEEQSVVIEESEIVNGGIGAALHRGGILTIRQTTIRGLPSGLAVSLKGEAKIVVERSALIGFLWDPASLTSYGTLSSIAGVLIRGEKGGGVARVLLRNNKILAWPMGVAITSIGFEEGWTQVRAELTENEIARNRVAGGVYLVGDPVVELNRNVIYENGYGVQLFLPPCVAIRSGDIVAFRGVVLGRANEIRDNAKGDLCPVDYPWPPGFRKP